MLIQFVTSSSHSLTTLVINSSLSLPGYSNPVNLKYEFKLQANPSTNLLIGCMTHQLSTSINDDFFVIILGQPGLATTESRTFTDNSVNLYIGSGGPIPVSLTFGNKKIPLWNDFSLNYTNFEPALKYNNGTNLNISECHDFLLKDSTNLCFYHMNTVLNCSNENTATSTVFPSNTSYTNPTLNTTLTSKVSVTNTVSPSAKSTSNPSSLSSLSSTSAITTTFTSPSTTLLPPNPTIINCTYPTSTLDSIYCDLSKDEIIPTSGNISSITNATLAAINPPTMSPKEIYAVAYILEQCSLITNLTEKDFAGMAQLFDTIMLAPEKSYEDVNDYSNAANSLILTINRMMTNSPSDVKYLHGTNIALLGKSLNCNNNDAGGIADLGNSFTENLEDKKFEASISINGETVCEAQATRVYYAIYRNSKFFVGDSVNGNGIISAYRINEKALKSSSQLSAATTSRKSVDLGRSCQKGLQQTDGRVYSATALKGTQKRGFVNIHKFQVNNEDKIMVNIKYNEEYIGIPLHGKFKISWWDYASNQWSPQTCDVKKESNYYISECSHLTDFTLLVSGTTLDPLFCNTPLQIINYFLAIGSIIGLFILCLIYLTMIIPYASNLSISRSLFKIIPISDISLISMVYAFILLLFYFNFTMFTDQRRTTGYDGCVAVAVISYWLLMSCIILSLFNSWRIIKEHVKGTTMDKFFGRITTAKIIYPVTFLFSTLLALTFGLSTSGRFFYRNDSLCWVRPEYKLAIIIPFTILGLSAIICVLIMSIRRFPLLEKYFTINRVKTINRPNSPNVKSRLFVLFLTQFNLGLPWLLQYFTLFSPEATIWHYLFVIFNGSQGIIIFIAFIYRCYMESKLKKTKETTIKEWKKSRIHPTSKTATNGNVNNLQETKNGENERHKTINIDENCIQVISRAPSQALSERKHANGKQTLSNIQGTESQINSFPHQSQNQNGTKRSNGYLNVNDRLQPDQLRIDSVVQDNGLIESIQIPNAAQNNLAPAPIGNSTRHTSEGYLADTSEDDGSSDSLNSVHYNSPVTNQTVHKKSANLLGFNYVIDRVGSRVMRVYKDCENHSHYYYDSPPLPR